MDAETWILSIDLGTSGPKVALVRTDGTVAAHEFEPVEVLLLDGGGAEQRPADWWTATTRAARRLMGRGVAAPEEVAAVGVTAQWSGTVAVDAAGQPLGNAVIWMDTRGAPHVERLTDGLLHVEGYAVSKLFRWLRLTGGAPSRSGKDPLAHILYLREERPEVYAAADKLLEPKDYLNLQLTGRAAASFDSIALYWLTDNRDLRKVGYHPTLLRLAGVDRAKLPELGRAVDVLGPLLPGPAEELGLPAGLPVVTGAPDLQSAAVGSGAVRDFEGHLYVGTSSWLTCHVPFKRTSIRHNMATLPSAIPGRYFVANEQECAGACLNFLRDKVLVGQDELSPAPAPGDVYRTFDAMAARAAPGAQKLLFLPWLYGERTPVEDPNVRGGFLNLSLAHGRDHLVRAVFEGVALNSRWLLGAVEGFIQRPFPYLQMIGGGAKSEVWCQIFADVLGRPIRQVADPLLANVRGAAAIAAVGLGRLTFEELAASVRIERLFHPQPENQRLYDDLYRELLTFYRRNRRGFARLNAPNLSKRPP